MNLPFPHVYNYIFSFPLSRCHVRLRRDVKLDDIKY